jgi:outer membrane protein/protease secretion system outer membrane protein
MRRSRRNVLSHALIVALTGAGLHAAPAAAIDLLQSYELALANDGQLKVAKARADAGREVLPQATAQLYPNVSFGYNYGHTRQDRSLNSLSEPMQYFPSKSGVLSLRQPIYRKPLFAQLDEAKAKVRGTDAQLDTDFQQLGVRVATSYFDALFARDALTLIVAQKATYEAQLRAAKMAFAAGSGTRTDIDEVQARYDLLLADEIKTRQAIGASTQQLEIFVGEPIQTLSTLDPARFDANERDPVALAQWVDRALEYNPELRALKARYEAATASIEGAKGGHYPTLDLVLQHSESVGDSTNTFPRTETKSSYAGVQLSVPIFAGGYVNSTVRQAIAAADEAREGYEYARDDLRLRVKREFDALKAGVSRVRALETALQSSDQVVLSNQKGVLAGTRTTLDVLTVEQQRFNTQVDLARARYLVLVSWATLQGYVGDLNTEAIARINRVLTASPAAAG